MLDAIKLADLAGPIPVEVAQQVIISEASDLAPLYMIADAGGGSSVTNSPLLEWYGSTVGIVRTLINGGAFNAGSTTLTVDSTAQLQPGHMLAAEASDEIMLVGTIVDATNITVTRGAFGTTAQSGSVADNAPIRSLGKPQAEGSAVGTASMSVPTKQTTQVAMFREPIVVTGLVGRTETDLESERGRQTRVKLREVMVDVDQQFLLSSFGSETVGGKVIRTMQGLRGAITQETVVGGALSESAFNAHLEVAFAHGSGKKVLLGGGTMLNTLQSIYGTRVRQASSDVAVGVAVSKILTVHGEIEVVAHRGLSGNYSGDGVIVDSDNLAIRHTNIDEKQYGGLPHINRNVGVQGDDSSTDEVTGELCLTWGDVNTHSLITGVTGAA